MGKYQPLADYLGEIKDDVWNASFQEIERILKSPLPESARKHRAWWANQYRGNHSQAKGWIEAGWETRDIDQRSGTVRFERTKRAGRSERPLSEHELWKQAAIMSGISDRRELEIAAVNALIEREAGRRLASIGGSMAEAWAPPRERTPE
ncbi:MAG: hypothetical protein ACK4YM_06270 [Novosphingobium sp.]